MEGPTFVTNTSSSKRPGGDCESSVQTEKKKTKKNHNDAHRLAYQGFSYKAIPSSGRPGTPHRFFAESYRVLHNDETVAVVHRHVNGLAVVTAGGETAASILKDNPAFSVEFRVQEAPAQSQGGKRKSQAKMLKGRKVDHVVRPSDDLAIINSAEDGQQELLHCCCGVWGSVLELNPRLTRNPGLVLQDPLLDGYLAIVLPSGPFPPTENVLVEPDDDTHEPNNS